MQNPIIVAALVSAVISAIVSAGTAFWTANLEMDKVVLAAQHSAFEIIQARLKAYPHAYRLVSQMEKDACDTVAGEKPINRDYQDLSRISINREELETLRAAFDDWDSSNAHLLGPDSTNTVHAFRQQLLHTISESKPGDFSCEKLGNLLYHAGQVELALRSDLGIYGMRIQGSTELQTPPVKRY